MSIQDATRDYEHWLGRHLTLVPNDLAFKYRRMAAQESPFPFLRATFYRWAQKLPDVCPEAMDAPTALCIGDLHVENFGTWRDSEGRLVYGVNDFDEAFELPYTSDLLRLATSAVLAFGAHAPGIKDVCQAVFSGYTRGIEARRRGSAIPTVLAERNRWLSPMIQARNPSRFWQELSQLPPIARIPAAAAAAIHAVTPDPRPKARFCTRRAGLGSLGRQRYCALTQWRGGFIAREAKALAPSACVWAAGRGPARSRVAEAEAAGVRSPDPCRAIRGNWIARRLAPDCDKLDPGAMFELGMVHEVLALMGSEAAHALGASDKQLRAIAKDLKRRAGWLRKATKAMAKQIVKDWERWRGEPLDGPHEVTARPG